MNIALVVNHYMPDRHGGFSTYVRYFCETMARQGHRIFVVASVTDPGRSGETAAAGMIIHNVLVPAKGAVRRYRARQRAYAALLEKYHREYGLDWINTHSGHWLRDVYRSRVLQPVPVFYTFHASLPFEVWFDWRKNRSRGLRRLVVYLGYRLRYVSYRRSERRALERSRAVVVLSEFVRGQITSFYPGIDAGKVHVIPGGIPEDTVCTADRCGARTRLGLPDGRIIFFVLRRMVPRMGLENLVDALDGLRDDPRWVAVFGGDGVLRRSLEERVRQRGLDERIRFTGYIPEADIPYYYKSADAFILPTEELEGFGLVTLEALGNGVPEIATNAGATPEILNRFYPELIADGVDVAGLREKIGLFLAEYDRYRDGFGAVDELRERYGWDGVCRRITGMLESVR